MQSLRVLAIISWIALPTVMYGGYSLLGFLTRGGRLSAFQEQYFRAGHAHAGVLLLMSLLYYLFLGRTNFTPGMQVAAFALLFIGALAQSGGFFLHMGFGKPGSASIGTTTITVGTILLALALIILIYGLIVA